MTTTMLDLFEGRTDAYFDCYMTRPDSDALGGLRWVDNRETWLDVFSAHNFGDTDIGVYPRRDDGTCRWGCVDIDSGDFSEALEVYGRLNDAGVGGWIEASGSWKDLDKRGYHVWVFATDWTPADAMRALLVEIVHQAGLPDKTEINPKQVKATPKAVGNCVRLPYGRRSTEHLGYSTMILSPEGEYRIDGFTRNEFLGLVVPVDVEMIVALGASSLRRSTMRQAVLKAISALRAHESSQPPFGAQIGKGGTSQRAWKILHGLDRAGEGERNNCAFVMACHLRGSGRPLDVAASEMTMAVERSFDGGAEFTPEALRILERIYQEWKS